jgi:hypothetical protein
VGEREKDTEREKRDLSRIKEKDPPPLSTEGSSFEVLPSQVTHLHPSPFGTSSKIHTLDRKAQLPPPPSQRKEDILANPPDQGESE